MSVTKKLKVIENIDTHFHGTQFFFKKLFCNHECVIVPVVTIYLTGVTRSLKRLLW